MKNSEADLTCKLHLLSRVYLTAFVSDGSGCPNRSWAVVLGL